MRFIEAGSWLLIKLDYNNFWWDRRLAHPTQNNNK